MERGSFEERKKKKCFCYSSLLPERATIAYHQDVHGEAGKTYVWQDTQDTHMHGNVNLRYRGKILLGFRTCPLG